MELKKYLKCPSCKKLKKRKQFYWDKRTHWRCMHCEGLQVDKTEKNKIKIVEVSASLPSLNSDIRRNF